MSSPSRSFHCLQATWHARQPMQLAMSMRVVRIGTGAEALGVVMPASLSWRPAAVALTTLTRQALVSCVPAPGSVASIVRWFTLAPVERPLYPQL